MDSLIKWVEDNGGFVDKDIYLHTYPNGDRSLKSKKFKHYDDVIIRIPYNCFITGSSWIECCIKLTNEFYKKDKSFYYPYLAMLPKISAFSEYPLFKFSSKDDINIINNIYPECANLLKILYSEIDELSTIINNLEFPPEFKTLEWKKYIIALHHTRAWKVGFIPVLDLIQHTQSETNKTCNSILFIKEESVIFSKNIQPDLDLYYCYRPGNIADFYISYGIPPILDINCVNIHISIDNMSQIQKDLMIKFNYGLNPISLNFAEKDIDLDTLKKARILTFDEDKINDDFPTTTTLENNKNAIKLIILVLKKSFQKLPEIKYEKYNIIYDIVNKHNEIIEKSIKEFQAYWMNNIN